MKDAILWLVTDAVHMSVFAWICGILSGIIIGSCFVKARTKFQWIPVLDAHPEDGEWVLVWEDLRSIGRKYQGPDVLYFRKGIGFVECRDCDEQYGCITHWMPIPKHE